jgi:hypothetical protein
MLMNGGARALLVLLLAVSATGSRENLPVHAVVELASCTSDVSLQQLASSASDELSIAQIVDEVSHLAWALRTELALYSPNLSPCIVLQGKSARIFTTSSMLLRLRDAGWAARTLPLGASPAWQPEQNNVTTTTTATTTATTSPLAPVELSQARRRAQEVSAACTASWGTEASLLASLQRIATTRCPAVTRLHSIGTSTEGRPLWVLELSESPGVANPAKAEVRLVGNMHGDEVVGRELLLRFASQVRDTRVAHSAPPRK